LANRDVTWLIGGPQGGGINVSAETLARTMVRGGLRVFTNIEYHSNIMGEHSYYRVRISEEDRHSILDRVNLVVALDEETLLGEPHVKFTGHHGHLHELLPGGAAV
jgi:2-oxoglutarate ferredoxin oxidoreductase subunit alpha